MQRFGGAGFHTGRAGGATGAQIAFVGFGFVADGRQLRAVLADHRAGDHLHGAVGAGHHAGFAADAAFLHHQHHAVLAADGAVGADVGAGRVFTLAA
ncbi:hypothetical protein D3C75_1224750 [compost metagenome]